MPGAKQLVKNILYKLGVKREFVDFFGLKKTLTLYLSPSSLKNTDPFLQSLPENCKEFLRLVDLGHGDLVLDLGANVGEVSNFFLTKNCTVKAYEANPVCIEFLNKRFQGNNNIQIFHKAVSNNDGEISFFIASNSLSSSIINRDEKYETTEIRCPSVNISSILSKSPIKVKLIKMDIEGGEYDILDELLKPENIQKFEFCAVEVHYDKIPGLVKRHEDVVRKIKLQNVEEKFFLNWN